MNNKFKRAISSILAFVMVISVLTVMNVSNVFAASVSNSKDWDMYSTFISSTIPTTDSETLTVDDFTIYGGSSMSAGSNSQTFTYSDGTTTKTLTGYVQTGGSSTYATSADSMVRVFAFTPAVAGTVDVFCRPSGESARAFYVSQGVPTSKGDTESALGSKVISESTATANYIIENVSVEAGETVYMWGASSGWRLYGVTFTPSNTPTISVTTSAATIAPKGTATVTATITKADGADVTWTSSDTSIATVVENEDDSTAVVTGVANGTAKITASITVNEVTYSDSVEIEVDDGSVKTVSKAGISIDFEDADTYGSTVPNDKATIDDGTVLGDYLVANGSDNVFRNNNGYYLELAGNAASSIQFTTSIELDVTVGYTSTGGNNVSLINIKDSDGAPVGILGAAGNSGTSHLSTYTITLPAGTYDIYSACARATRLYSVSFAEATGNATDKTVVAAIGDTTYVFFGVDSDKLDSASFDVNVDGTIVTDSNGDTVYKGVTIGATEVDTVNETTYTSGTTSIAENYSPSALGISTEYEYVVGYKLSSTAEVKEASSYTLSYN